MDRITAARVFVEVVDSGSQTAAAEHLDISRAMVSRYLAALEEWVGARLLHRTTRKLSLTQVGSELLPHCREMLLTADLMRSTGLKANDGPSGNLRITTSQSFAQTWLSPILVEYLARYPNTSVDVLVSSQAVNLVEERIDLALRITNQLEPNQVARHLGTCHSVVCAAPGYLDRAGTPQHPDELNTHNCLTYSYFGRSFWQFQAAGETLDVAVAGNLSSNDTAVLLEAAMVGGGVCMQPLYAAAPLIESGRLVRLLPDWQPQALGIHAIYASRRQMLPALRTLLDFLAERLAADPLWQAR
ncbi:LysR family transcriptional regulator [Pseudomonas daroniae]|uniref:LysR family transcriptional regulator n=1 Tax=Phytopseudomonas daroniae TaxID=2487519 RepID=A0A4Q9QHY7_9GAMM|nr:MULTISPECIES: LysR family transcriptional regulator [Pseudomonas]TBU75022.1 LysR family transcriptional regulator [Pseudomonas daroniae]TBU75248.1 LysR family transcriptional regulator [Pseudomonas daroniae]TBU80394.1 LysR family transcriptional regulator [Pseudomonas sp. FRB 228]TBU89121.1 LysR family transcriptional regulator [Pseudomonas daroniae]